MSRPAGTRQTIKHDRMVVVVSREIVTLVSLIEENVIEKMLARSTIHRLLSKLCRSHWSRIHSLYIESQYGI